MRLDLRDNQENRQIDQRLFFVDLYAMSFQVFCNTQKGNKNKNNKNNNKKKKIRIAWLEGIQQWLITTTR